MLIQSAIEREEKAAIGCVIFTVIFILLKRFIRSSNCFCSLYNFFVYFPIERTLSANICLVINAVHKKKKKN